MFLSPQLTECVMFMLYTRLRMHELYKCVEDLIIMRWFCVIVSKKKTRINVDDGLKDLKHNKKENYTDFILFFLCFSGHILFICFGKFQLFY